MRGVVSVLRLAPCVVIGSAFAPLPVAGQDIAVQRFAEQDPAETDIAEQDGAGKEPGADQEATEDAVDDNAVTQAADAFGRQVGTERTGLYDDNGIRGFNPVDAGNVRIETLYFDQVDRLTPRLRDATTIRVGLGAQGFAFPAPTGLVDYTLQAPGEERQITLDVSTRLNGNPGGSLEVRYPGLLRGIDLFTAIGHRYRRHEDGRNSVYSDLGTLLRFDAGRAGISMIGGYKRERDEEARVTLYPATDLLPPKIERGRDLSQPWADNDKDTVLAGTIAQVPVGSFRIDGGLFYNRTVDLSRYADLLVGVRPDGTVAERIIVGDAGATDRSWSGELRISRAFVLGQTSHYLSASIRGRNRFRLFGGAQRIMLGQSSVLAPDIRTRPDVSPGAKNEDRVRQMFYGVAYSGRFAELVDVDLGVSHIDYRKQVDFADPSLAPITSEDRPLAWNALVALGPIAGVTAYGGLARGMEEALVAPDRAVNRAESPAAIRIRQEEAGVRYQNGIVTALAGWFRITKPYYNLDPLLRYRLLGTVVNKGLEVSLVARPLAGLTVLGGGVFSDPAIGGEAVDAGIIAQRPVGQATRRIITNLDWQPASGTSAWSFDLAFANESRRAANAGNTLYVPSSTTFDLGFRYRADIADTDLLIRGRLENLFDEYAWNVSSAGGLTYSEPRRFTIQLIAEW